MESLFGKSLKGKEANVDTSTLAGESKAVLIYFSAHWCPPCRKFTPQLVEWYNTFKSSDKGASMELVFVSSDRDESSFNEYYGEMPWLALPFEERERKATLSSQFKVQGIPSLIVVDANTGELITKDGRNKVTSDPEGKEFPWRPMPLDEILSGTATGKDGDVSLAEKLEGKIRALYFSAHWCPPCRGFTPKLVESYNKVVADGKNFEVVFVSWDKTDQDFKEYYDTMPWLAIPYSNKCVGELNSKFEVEGIPSLIILDEKNEIITVNGRGAISADPEGKEFPWYPKPLNELTGDTASDINEKPCVIYLTDAKEEDTKKAIEVMKPIAEAYCGEKKENDDLPDLAFFYEGDKTEDLSESVRQFLKLGDKAPLLVLVNIPEGKKYVSDDVDVAGLVDKFKSKTLEMKPLRE